MTRTAASNHNLGTQFRAVPACAEVRPKSLVAVRAIPTCLLAPHTSPAKAAQPRPATSNRISDCDLRTCKYLGFNSSLRQHLPSFSKITAWALVPSGAARELRPSSRSAASYCIRRGGRTSCARDLRCDLDPKDRLSAVEPPRRPSASCSHTWSFDALEARDFGLPPFVPKNFRTTGIAAGLHFLDTANSIRFSPPPSRASRMSISRSRAPRAPAAAPAEPSSRALGWRDGLLDVLLMEHNAVGLCRCAATAAWLPPPPWASGTEPVLRKGLLVASPGS